VPVNTPLLNIVDDIIHPRIPQLVIYDDFDVVPIPQFTNQMRSLMNIFVSTTNNNDRFYQVRSNDTPVQSLEQLLQNMERKSLMDIKFSNAERQIDIRMDDKFIQRSIQIPAINYYTYKFTNENEVYIGLVADLAGGGDIYEMLNSDAVDTAAKHLGILETSPSAIFKKLLNNNYDAYIYNTLLIARIDDFIKCINSLENSKETYSAAKITKCVEDIKRKHSTHSILSPSIQTVSVKGKEKDNTVPAVINQDDDIKKIIEDNDITHNDAKLADAMNGAKSEADKNMKETSKAITRMRDNISGGTCLICFDDLAGKNVSIMKCCNVIMCSGCCVSNSRKDDSGKITGTCPNCRHKYNIQTDTMLISKNFDLSNLMKCIGNEVDTTSVLDASANDNSTANNATDTTSTSTTTTSKYEKIKNGKHRTIVEIANNISIDNAKQVNMNFGSVMTGVGVVQPPIHKKMIIFAPFAETIGDIAKILTEYEIGNLVLRGTYHEMIHTIKKFRDDDKYRALIINSTHNCAGLNLQFATDIIFVNHIMNDNILSQAIGRGQRIGRSCSLSVHFLLYANEDVSAYIV
jgi:hypothetical protein